MQSKSWTKKKKKNKEQFVSEQSKRKYSNYSLNLDF